MGFQDMHGIVHEAASRKGGRIKVKKGIGALSPEKRKEIASMGGIAKRDKSRSGEISNKSQEDQGDDTGLLEKVLRTLDE